MDAANNEKKTPLYTVGYVIRNSIKHGKTQKAIENAY